MGQRGFAVAGQQEERCTRPFVARHAENDSSPPVPEHGTCSHQDLHEGDRELPGQDPCCDTTHRHPSLASVPEISHMEQNRGGLHVALIH